MKNKLRGFTLIEMMITIGIIAILASIAYPSYIGNVKKSRRVEAQTALQQIATMEEQLFSETGSYTTDLRDLGLPNARWNWTENSYYRLRAWNPTASCPVASCYRLQAQPRNEQASDKWEFRLDSNGRKFKRQGSGRTRWVAGSWEI